jgi:phage gp29-like protein
MLKGEPMPERKFIVHSVGAKDGNPYGLGLGSKLFWPVWFKRQGITFWLTFLDKFGSPTAVGKYPNGTNKTDQDKLLEALAAISQDAGVSIPEGMVIELLEATRGGQAGYESLCRYMDEQISYCILGEAPGAKNSGGALASAAITRNEVRLELVQFDADMLSATLNKTLVSWISEFNVPGATPPTVWRKIVEPEDIKVRAERDKILFEMGMRPDADYQAENYPGWTMTKPPLPVGAALDAKSAQFSEGVIDPDPTYTQLDSEELDTQPAQAALDKALAPVIDALMQTKNAQEAMDMLAKLFPKMDDSALQGLLARAFFVADVMGQMNANS